MARFRRWLACRLFAAAFRIDPCDEYFVGVDFDEEEEKKLIMLSIGMVTIHVPITEEEAQDIGWTLIKDKDAILDEIAEAKGENRWAS